MYKTVIFWGLFVVVGVTAFGQNAGVSGKTDASATRPTSATAGPVLSAGTSLEAQLQNSIDAGRSRVGDEVILRTTKAIKQNGGTLVPKGTTLVGRITEVQKKTKGNAVSRVGMVFNRLQGKDLDVPISVSIVSVASAQVNAANDMLSANAAGSGNASASGNTGTSSSGGLLGGVGSTLGSAVNTATQTVGNVAGTATNTVGHTTGSAVRTVNGLQISSSAGGSASSSSTISAQGKDVRIDKGVTFQLRVEGSTQN